MRDGTPRGEISLGELRSLYLNNNQPVTLSARAPIALIVAQKLQVVRESGSNRRMWTVVTTAYNYALRLPDGPEIVAYQWEQDAPGWVTFPHLHIGRGATGNVTTFGPRGLHRIHFPTRHVTIEDVLRLAITEFGVEPRRQDWEHILGDS
jgi:hypothetical protein